MVDGNGGGDVKLFNSFVVVVDDAEVNKKIYFISILFYQKKYLISICFFI